LVYKKQEMKEEEKLMAARTMISLFGLLVSIYRCQPLLTAWKWEGEWGVAEWWQWWQSGGEVAAMVVVIGGDGGDGNDVLAGGDMAVSFVIHSCTNTT
jgi:hypothetical protein